MKENKTITVAVRITPEEKQKLENLSQIYGGNLSNTIRELINKEYQRIRS